MTVCAGIVLLADKVWPEADAGNCWSFAGPKWLRGGGYLAVRTVPSARFLMLFPVLHAVWLKDMPAGADLEMTRPIHRHRAAWIPWRTFYFKFRVARIDKAARRGDA